MTMLQKFEGKTLDEVLEIATDAEFSAWEKELAAVPKVLPAAYVASQNDDDDNNGDSPEVEDEDMRKAKRIAREGISTNPPKSTESRQVLMDQNSGLRRTLGLRERTGLFAATMSAMSDTDLHAENLRLRAQMDAMPVNSPTLKPGAYVEHSAGQIAQARSRALTITEKCLIALGVPEERARLNSVQPRQHYVIPKPGSVTARCLEAKGLATDTKVYV